MSNEQYFCPKAKLNSITRCLLTKTLVPVPCSLFPILLFALFFVIFSLVKAAIVGLGRIASLLEEDSLREKPCTHAGAIAANADCDLAAGCDIDEERRLLFAQKWQVPVYADAAEMLGIHKPQLLAIATHPDSHYHYCRLAADSGVQAVICEKPLAANIGEARKIARLAKNGPVIITNHERRYSEDYIRAKSVLAGGKLGGLLSVRAVLYMGRTKRLIDVLWHDGTHLADAIMFLTGMTLKHKKRRGAKLSANAGTAWLEGILQGNGEQGTGNGEHCSQSERDSSTQCLHTKTLFPSPCSLFPFKTPLPNSKSLFFRKNGSII